jgi:3-oxoacyl-[acyl-carrier protein] reductase
MCSRNEQAIAACASEIMRDTGSEIWGVSVDLEDSAQIDRFLKSVHEKWGRIDILVTNGGGPPVKTFAETSDEEWEKYFRSIFMSVVTAIRRVSQYMKAQKSGRIINITSISVKEPVNRLVFSNALRLAVVGLAKTVATELGPFGITVHNVAPGYHRTDGLERIVKKRMEEGEQRDDIYREWENGVPLRRIGNPEDLAALIVFLASGHAAYMTGTTIQVDGGKYSGTM